MKNTQALKIKLTPFMKMQGGRRGEGKEKGKKKRKEKGKREGLPFHVVLVHIGIILSIKPHSAL